MITALYRAEIRSREAHAELPSLVHPLHQARVAEGLADPVHFETSEMGLSVEIELQIDGAKQTMIAGIVDPLHLRLGRQRVTETIRETEA